MKIELSDDGQLRDNVIDEIAYDPVVTHFDITVTSHNGVITLYGFVDSVATRCAAKTAAWRVFGVRDVVDKLLADSLYAI